MNIIIWSELVYISFTDVANYLTENYSLDTAMRFNDEMDNLLSKLESFKSLCPPYELRPILRKCNINRYSSLLYRVDNEKIHLITFFNNRGIHSF